MPITKRKAELIAARALMVAADSYHLPPAAYVECAWGHLSNRSLRMVDKAIKARSKEFERESDGLTGERWD